MDEFQAADASAYESEKQIRYLAIVESVEEEVEEANYGDGSEKEALGQNFVDDALDGLSVLDDKEFGDQWHVGWFVVVAGNAIRDYVLPGRIEMVGDVRPFEEQAGAFLLFGRCDHSVLSYELAVPIDFGGSEELSDQHLRGERVGLFCDGDVDAKPENPGWDDLRRREVFGVVDFGEEFPGGIIEERLVPGRIVAYAEAHGVDRVARVVSVRGCESGEHDEREGENAVLYEDGHVLSVSCSAVDCLQRGARQRLSV